LDRRQAIAGLIGAGLFPACGRSHRIQAGSKNFTEQIVLGEIVAQHLGNRLRQVVDRKLDLGGTLLAHQALVAGGIDVYPEYTGTALTAVLHMPPLSDPAAVFNTVREEYERRFGLMWLPPLGFNDSFAMVVRADVARRAGLATLSDAAEHTEWALGVGYEFLQRPDGLPALMKTYGLRVKGHPKTMDLGLLYEALQQGQVSMVAGNTTDGLLSVLDVVVLRDDKHAFPPYEAALVTRRQSLAAHPGMQAALLELSGSLPDRTMQALNYSVEGKHEAARQVAASFLRGKGLA
jgi:osmoprotectant transport system substrate-binding protein